MSNTVTPCQEWQIADVNHDNTKGTVDLFPKYVLNNNDKDRLVWTVAMNWPSSNQSGLYSGFTDDIKNSIIDQTYDIPGHYGSGEILTNTTKVKTPSAYELGISDGRYMIDLGNPYPLFGNLITYGDSTDHLSRNYVHAFVEGWIMRESYYYWTRSQMIPSEGGGSKKCTIGGITMAMDYEDDTADYVGIIRFGKK